MLEVTRVQGGKRLRKKQGGMRGRITISVVLTLALFFLPFIFATQPLLVQQGDQSKIENPSQLPSQSQLPAVKTNYDIGRPVRVLHADGTVEVMNMAQYLWSVVAAEMPAGFELEALKAQAAAARTYTVQRQSLEKPRHENADICTDSSCCQAFVAPEEKKTQWGDNAQAYAEKIDAAVSQTDGLGILYGGVPIQAVFFSSAAGQTADAVAVWGNAVDYLVSVESPEGEEVPNYHTQVTFSAQEFKEKIHENYPTANLKGTADTWLGTVKKNDAGRVTEITIGGMSMTGDMVRAALSLRSSCFSAQYQNGEFVFTVTGYGHGVGMSQYGANAMAKNGKTAQEILTWYYTGTTVDLLW